MNVLSQKEFLERIPPGTKTLIRDFEITSQGYQQMSLPEIELHCTQCNGQRFFSSKNSNKYINHQDFIDTFLHYICRNCRKRLKTFALCAEYDQKEKKWSVFKYGEEPSFGPPTPARTITLIGPDRDQFLKGRRSENQGLGIGAFAYYRRVVENQKNQIFDEIIRVSNHLGSDEQLIADLEAAKKETQFTKGVDTIKHALPQSLLVNGQNPLLLLHSALSKGVHELTDAECLEIASSVRIILIELADRLSQAMKDEAELNEAVNRLSRKKG